jgi:hypothetical protein
MAKEPARYEINEEFNEMASKLVDKYPDKFLNVEVDKIRCVNITNKERQTKEEDTTDRIWKIQAVKMPIRLDCPYAWYIILHEGDWAELSEKHKLALVADVLHGIPVGVDNEGKVEPVDTKGYHSVFKTLGIDFLTDPDIPHLLEDDVEWKD